MATQIKYRQLKPWIAYTLITINTAIGMFFAMLYDFTVCAKTFLIFAGLLWVFWFNCKVLSLYGRMYLVRLMDNDEMEELK